MSSLTIRAAGEGDCAALGALAARTFTDTFGHLYTPENLRGHLAQTCSVDYFHAALAEGDTMLLAHHDNTLAGYGKTGRMRLPHAPVSEGAMEIHRLYIDRAHQAHGYGKRLMEAMLALPGIAAAPVVYLSVWEENHRAQAFYARYGFVPVGRYLYQVGNQYDREIIMARDLRAMAA